MNKTSDSLSSMRSISGPDESPFSLLDAVNKAPDWLRKGLLGIGAARMAYQLSNDVREHIRSRLTYQITVPSTDHLWRPVNLWIIGQLKRQRSIMVSTHRHGDGNLVVERFFSGDRTQVLYLQGQKIWVHVDASEVPRHLEHAFRMNPDKIVFTSYTTAGRDAVYDLLTTLSQAKDDRNKLFVSDGWRDWREVRTGPPRTLETVVLAKGQMERLRADLGDFLGQEQWYADLGVPWHRGYLFEGPAGTGKTSVAKVLASEFNMDAYVLSVSSVTKDSELTNMLIEIEPHSMLIVEDIDVAHAAKERDDKAQGVTLSGLLNALDGLATPHGVVSVLTTNHREVLDEALVRPGRIDLQEHFGYVDDDQFSRLVEMFTGTRFLGRLRSADVTPAQVIEVVKRHPMDSDGLVAALQQWCE